MPVVLVPGFRDNTRKVAYLARRLRAAGFVPVPISPQPTDGTVGLDVLARDLACAIDATVGRDHRFYLFGFSMGGLIARWYVQMLGGNARVLKLVTLATPNRGSWASWLYPRRAACRQMRPGSAFLARLNADLRPLEHVDYTSFWQPLDLTIVPASSSYLPVGTMRPLTIPRHTPFHGLLLRDTPTVDEIVEAFLDQARNGMQNMHAKDEHSTS